MKDNQLILQLESLGLNEISVPNDLAQWQAFLLRIERAYHEAEQERYLLERSLQISSKEVQDRWQTVEEERARALQSSRMASLGEMAGGVAHEINNPLALIQILTSQASEELAEIAPNKELLQEHLTKIEKTVKRIADIVHGLRTFSRDASSDPFAQHALLEIVNDTTSLCAARLKQHSVELKIDPIDPALSLQCRAPQLSQVLLNLLNNAHDAIENQAAKWIHLAVESTEKEVCITITDSGKGIPYEVQQKIFQPFYTTKPVGKGTGLGLSLSRGIIEAHRGSITIDQACPNTRFIITLPLKQAKSAPKKSA